RAFGYGSNSDILRLFFGQRELDLTKKRESRTDQREILGAIIAEDIELPGEATPADAPKARTKKLRAERERAENVLLVKEGGERPKRRQLAVDVVDPDSGEVLAETGQNLTDTVIKKLRKHEIVKIQVFVTSGRAESTLIKNTIAKDPTKSLTEKDKESGVAKE